MSAEQNVAKPEPTANAIRQTYEQNDKNSLRSLLQFSNLVSKNFWSLSWIRWLAWVSLFPLLVYTLVASELITSSYVVSILIAAYFGVIWILLYTVICRPQLNNQKIVVLLVQVILVMNVLLIPLVIFAEFSYSIHIVIVQGLLDILDVYVEQSFLEVVYYIIGVGFPEEVGKAIPVFWLVIKKNTFLNARTTVFVGCISGLVFGVSEAVVYICQGTWLDGGDYALFIVVRLVTLIFVHSIWAGIVGYFIAVAARNAKFTWLIMLSGILLIGVLHGLYDGMLVTDHPIYALVMILVSFILFINYLMNTYVLDQESHA